MKKTLRKRQVAVRKRGMAALEVVAFVDTVVVLALSAYAIAERSCGGLYHVISTIVGSPYL